MLILKRTKGVGEVFDTENIEARTNSNVMPDVSSSLHLHHHTTDLTFLRQFFPENHPVFIRFGESFYYVIKDVQENTGAAIVGNNVLPAVKGGRCFNGAHRDRGHIVHGVVTEDGKEPNGYWGNKSLCGSEPGSRSYGWSQSSKKINCQRCLNKLSVYPALPT